MTLQTLAWLFDDNLMSSSRVASQLETIGYRVSIARKLPAENTETPQLILLHLGSRSLNFEELIPQLKARFPDARLLGFCGHREIEIRKNAKALGIERILTNDQALMALAESL